MFIGKVMQIERKSFLEFVGCGSVQQNASQHNELARLDKTLRAFFVYAKEN